ncbi:hypothetical protein B0H14DRAFT_2561389 [Mycena olivaceomarginata]|nr:hypothetical protein B0H14DRAFT_2561389 [Mycena olivaceomarginata]
MSQSDRGQIPFFDANEGGTPSACIHTSQEYHYRRIAHSPRQFMVYKPKPSPLTASALYEAGGEVGTCGDEITWGLYPGFLTESPDLEAAWNLTCCRAGHAKLPCPRRLAPQETPHPPQRTLEAHTSSNMRAIACPAQNAPNATQKEKILMEHSLHDVVNFRFSDPYQAVSYDLLHFDESGKWGYYLWSLILDLLGELRLLTEMTDIMSKFPHWRNLKHIDDLATKDFTDGQTHFDILKCIVFVLVRLLPYKCSLIHCTRTLLQFRMMGGLHGMTDSRIEVFQTLIGTYEDWCERVSKDYNKNFPFPKQHFIVHAVQDIRSKGVL